jgi:hypothetical protein
VSFHPPPVKGVADAAPLTTMRHRNSINDALRASKRIDFTNIQTREHYMRGFRPWFVTTALLSPFLQANAALQFVDWREINLSTNVATGTIGSIGVTMSGGDIDSGVTNGSGTRFSSSAFSPSLPTSDNVGFLGRTPAFTYTITFSEPVTDPVMHLASLASTLTFSGISPVKVSGETTLIVAGSTVSGATIGSTDANGTIRLPGVFTSLNFTAQYTPGADGIYTQIGFDVAPVPELSTGTSLGAGLLLMVATALRRRTKPISK